MGDAEWHECHVVPTDRATMWCWVMSGRLMEMCAVARQDEGTVVPWYGLMVASQCENLNGWSLGVKAQESLGTKVAPDRVLRSI